MTRHTYKGVFSWSGEQFVLYTTATTKSSAFKNFITQLSNKVGYNYRAVAAEYLYDKKDNYSIERSTV